MHIWVGSRLNACQLRLQLHITRRPMNFEPLRMWIRINQWLFGGGRPVDTMRTSIYKSKFVRISSSTQWWLGAFAHTHNWINWTEPFVRLRKAFPQTFLSVSVSSKPNPWTQIKCQLWALTFVFVWASVGGVSVFRIWGICASLIWPLSLVACRKWISTNELWVFWLWSACVCARSTVCEETLPTVRQQSEFLCSNRRKIIGQQEKNIMGKGRRTVLVPPLDHRILRCAPVGIVAHSFFWKIPNFEAWSGITCLPVYLQIWSASLPSSGNNPGWGPNFPNFTLFRTDQTTNDTID